MKLLALHVPSAYQNHATEKTECFQDHQHTSYAPRVATIVPTPVGGVVAIEEDVPKGNADEAKQKAPVEFVKQQLLTLRLKLPVTCPEFVKIIDAVALPEML